MDPEEKWCGMKQVKKDKAGGNTNILFLFIGRKGFYEVFSFSLDDSLSFLAVQESVSLSLCEEFPKLLSDSSHLLRMHMASAISVLFVRHISEASAVPAPREHQYKIFSKVSQILVQSVTDSVAVSGC